MNLTHNLKIFPKLVSWPLTYDLFLKVMFVGNGVPWYRYRARVLLPSVWGLGTYAKVSLCDIDDFHIVRDLDWPCQRSNEVNDLWWRKLSFFLLFTVSRTLCDADIKFDIHLALLYVPIGHSRSRGHQRSTKVNDLWWPDMTFFEFLCFKSVSDAEFEFSTYELL